METNSCCDNECCKQDEMSEMRSTDTTSGDLNSDLQASGETKNNQNQNTNHAYENEEEDSINEQPSTEAPQNDNSTESDPQNGTNTESEPFIDVPLIPAKLSYFFMECFGGSFVPFIVVFLASTGLTIEEAGFITGIRLLASSIAAPLWGYLADRTRRPNVIFAVLCVGMAATIFPMPWVGRACGGGGVHNSSSHINITSTNKEMLFERDLEHNLEELPRKVEYFLNYSRPIEEEVSGNHTTVSHTSHKPFSNQLFYVMLVLVFVSNIFSNPINGFVDSFVMNVVKSHPRKSDYGKQRMFGAIGFGVSNALAGKI